MMIAITLSNWEWFVVSFIGSARRIRSVASKLNDRQRDEDETAWQNDIQGAAGEMAFAKWKNVFWCGHVDHFSGGDVGNAQIRTTAHENGCLILRENDRDQDRFYLVTGVCPHFVIRGWIRGREGKRQEFWRSPNGRPSAWFVPQSELKAPSLFV
jgi:hypothetical protein